MASSTWYISFIGDGDSFVYPTLISSVPWGYAITKIEYANHCVKCYRTISTQSSASQLQTTDLDDLDEVMLEQAEYWNDATDEKSLDEVRDIPDS